MRALLLAISIPAALLAGAASADTVTQPRQCAAPWAQSSSANICREGGMCRTPTLTRAAFIGANGHEDHVMTKAEVRAELDAVKVAAPAPVLLASEDR
jgi:hypothetical protein